MTVERCPVCGGNGLVDNGFYLCAGTTGEWTTSSAEPETCRSCDGKGYVVVEDDKLIFSGAVSINCTDIIDPTYFSNDVLKQNIINLVKTHKKTCDDQNCNVSLYLVQQVVEKAGIILTEDEMRDFV